MSVGPRIEQVQGLRAELDALSGGGVADLDDLTDVDLTGQANGDFLSRVGGVWVPVDAPSGGYGAWTSYTPTLVSSGTAVVLGTGSSVYGRYREDSETVEFELWIKFGTSGITVGTGFYKFLLPPVSPHADVIAHNHSVGQLNVVDASTGAVYGTATQCLDSDEFIAYNNGVNNVGAAAPVVPAASDQYSIIGRYRK